MLGLKVVLLGNVEVDKVTLKDRVCTHIEDRYENTGNSIGGYEDQSHWQVRRLDVFDCSEHEVADYSSSNGDADLCDGHEDGANCIDEGEFCSILEDKNKSICS